MRSEKKEIAGRQGRIDAVGNGLNLTEMKTNIKAELTRHKTMREHAGAKAYTPKDLELFQASEAQQRMTFRGYDKVHARSNAKLGSASVVLTPAAVRCRSRQVTTNPPSHGHLPKWNVRPEVIARLERGF